MRLTGMSSAEQESEVHWLILLTEHWIMAQGRAFLIYCIIIQALLK